MKELFEYLAQFPVDRYGTSWVSANQIVKDTGISRKELCENIQEIKLEAFLDIITTNVPSAEGLLSVTITPKNANNRLIIFGTIVLSHTTSGRNGVIALHQDATANALIAWPVELSTDNANQVDTFPFVHEMVAGVIVATTLRIRAGGAGTGTLTFSGRSGAALMGGVIGSGLVVVEVSL